MKLGIMQPYFMPYIGYWQLMNAVDQYVVYDDVNYIKGGWINRNRILLNNESKYFNIQMRGASPNKLINEIEVNRDKSVINKNLRILEAAYKKAPYFERVYPLMKEILCNPESNLAIFLFFSINKIRNYLGIETNLSFSSQIIKQNELRGQEKVLHICEILKASQYYNAIGGLDLYSFSAFKEKNIELIFLKTKEITYKQWNENFTPNLSIIDVIMFNSVEQIRVMLKQYTTITENDMKSKIILE